MTTCNVSSTDAPANTSEIKAVPDTEADILATANLARALHKELKPSTEVSRFFVERSARLIVRLRRCALVKQQVVDGTGVIDASPETVHAWKYEQATERSLFRLLREIEAIERKADPLVASHAAEKEYKKLASSLKTASRIATPTPAAAPQPVPPPIPKHHPMADPLECFPRVPYTNKLVTNNIPFSIGKKP